MTQSIERFIDWFTYPPIIFTVILAVFFVIFPPTDRLFKLHRRLHLDGLWTKKGAVVFFLLMTALLLFGIRDPNFRLLVLKPDNVPIVGLLFLMPFFVWLSMYQAVRNDRLLQAGEKPAEYHDPDDQVLVWPDLVFIELIALILMTVLLIVWSLLVSAPLEGPANPTVSPNPSKAPWYFLGLQELLVYFDPWIAGVVLPTILILGLMAIPYIDRNPEGQGYYSFAQRKMAISLYMFSWLALWLFLIFVGTFLRGPNWNFFGPFETWDVHKTVALNNVNLSDYIYIVLLGRTLPENELVREMWGLLLLFGYFVVLPAILAKTVLTRLYHRLGALRYCVFIFMVLVMFGLPVKMYLRWVFNLKYIVALPRYYLKI